MIAGSNVIKKISLTFYVCFLFVAFAQLQACSPADDAEAAISTEPALALSDQSSVNVSALSERWLLMNYWASWCAPCIEEIPELTKLNTREDFKVVLYNFDRLEGEKLKAEAGKLNIQLPMMLNEPAPLFKLDTPSALPATLVIDRLSGAHHWLMGAQTESGILAKLSAGS